MISEEIFVKEKGLCHVDALKCLQNLWQILEALDYADKMQYVMGLSLATAPGYPALPITDHLIPFEFDRNCILLYKCLRNGLL